MPTRLAAWLLTGPLGHLAAGLVDFAVLLARLARGRARQRTPDTAPRVYTRPRGG